MIGTAPGSPTRMVRLPARPCVTEEYPLLPHPELSRSKLCPRVRHSGAQPPGLPAYRPPIILGHCRKPCPLPSTGRGFCSKVARTPGRFQSHMQGQEGIAIHLPPALEVAMRQVLVTDFGASGLGEQSMKSGFEISGQIWLRRSTCV